MILRYGVVENSIVRSLLKMLRVAFHVLCQFLIILLPPTKGPHNRIMVIALQTVLREGGC